MSDSLWPHGLQHARLPHPLLSLWVCSDSCPLSQFYDLTITSSATPFFCLQSFPASGSFPVSQLFASDGQSVGASASVLPVSIQGWLPLRLTGLGQPVELGFLKLDYPKDLGWSWCSEQVSSWEWMDIVERKWELERQSGFKSLLCH